MATEQRFRRMAIVLVGGFFLVGATLAGCARGPAVRSASEGRESGPAAIEEKMVVPTGELHGGAAVGGPAEEGRGEGDSVAEVSGFVQYRIGSGDVLSFRSFDDETLSTEVTVRYDGCISLPWVADLRVSGLTRDEATELVRQAYGAIYGDPQVSLIIVTTQSKAYTVMGDVSRPGEYPYVRPITLLDSINAAGGLRLYTRAGDSFVGAQGQLVKALVIRHQGDERVVREHDLRGFQQSGSHASDTPVLPGDTVYVPESVSLVYVLGEVSRPDVFALSEGMTLLQLLARAGGFQESTARMRQVVLMREVNESSTEVLLINLRAVIKRGEDLPLQPGDVVYVPRKPLIHVQDFVDRFTGSISPILGLYSQAYDAYYTQDRFDRLFRDTTGTETETLSILQSIRDITEFSGSLIYGTGAR